MTRKESLEIFDRNTIRAIEYRGKGMYEEASFCQKTANMALAWLHQNMKEGV